MGGGDLGGGMCLRRDSAVAAGVAGSAFQSDSKGAPPLPCRRLTILHAQLRLVWDVWYGTFGMGRLVWDVWYGTFGMARLVWHVLHTQLRLVWNHDVFFGGHSSGCQLLPVAAGRRGRAGACAVHACYAFDAPSAVANLRCDKPPCRAPMPSIVRGATPDFHTCATLNSASSWDRIRAIRTK
eukprot:360663-Chlamydomonas_euryale.AAC.14